MLHAIAGRYINYISTTSAVRQVGLKMNQYHSADVCQLFFTTNSICNMLHAIAGRYINYISTTSAVRQVGLKMNQYHSADVCQLFLQQIVYATCYML